MDRTQTTLGSGFVAGGWWVGSAWSELGIIDRRAGRNVDLQVPLVAEARESNTVGYASASAAASKASSTVSGKSSPRWIHYSLRSGRTLNLSVYLTKRSTMSHRFGG
jgi:hypothetical protein